jgi:hypothetical protein
VRVRVLSHRDGNNNDKDDKNGGGRGGGGLDEDTDDEHDNASGDGDEDESADLKRTCYDTFFIRGNGGGASGGSGGPGGGSCGAGAAEFSSLSTINISLSVVEDTMPWKKRERPESRCQDDESDKEWERRCRVWAVDADAHADVGSARAFVTFICVLCTLRTQISQSSMQLNTLQRPH